MVTLIKSYIKYKSEHKFVNYEGSSRVKRKST